MATTLYPDKPCTECGKPSLGRNLCPSHYNAAWRIKNAERYTHTCVHCGESFKTWRKAMAACSLACQRRRAIAVAQPLAARSARKGTEVVLYDRPRTWAGTATLGKTWVQGACDDCGSQFTAEAGGRYCSERCRVRTKKSRRGARYGQFTVSRITRQAIYARDKYTCQLCLKSVDMTLAPTHRWAATLDHIEPQSRALIPDHSARNLRLSHRSCNSKRGDGSRGEAQPGGGGPLVARAA